MKTKLILIILFLATILRLWNLGGNPPHLSPDEASLGYNAYSILKTGRDEYGELLPTIFKSFGDYKPGLYVYLSVPVIATLGLSEFSVRLPSAIAGILAVWLIYQISYKLFSDKRLSYLSSFFLAVSPWHVHLSRGAWEVNVSLTLTLAGIYYFLLAIKKQKYLYHSATFFALTLFAYQGAKLATMVVLFTLVVSYWKDVKKWFVTKKVLYGPVILGVIISLPIIFSLFQGKAGRLEVFSVFSYPRPPEYLQNFLDQGEEKIGDLSYYPFHSETLNFTRGILGRWFNHFSSRFLFFEGDWQNPKHSAPNHGVMLLADLIIVVFGFVALVKYGLKKESKFLWIWLVLAPLPSVLSRDSVHAIRAYNLVIPLVLLASFGANHILKTINKGKWILTILYSASLIFFLDAYFIHLPIHDSKYWDYGYKQVVEAVTPIQENYETIKVRQSFAQPYIYFLFFQKYDPSRYQEQAKLTESRFKGDVGYVEKLDNICFCAIDWSVNRGEVGTLFVADPIRIPPEDSSDGKLFKLVKEIKYLNNAETAFRIIEVKQ